MILKEGKVLLGKRLGSHGKGEYAFPGGGLEYLETFEDCAKRETREECGIEIRNIRFLYLMNLLQYAPKHYVHIGLVADWASGEPRVLEKDKCESWEWYAPDALPHPLFGTIAQAIESFRTGKNYFGSRG